MYGSKLSLVIIGLLAIGATCFSYWPQSEHWPKIRNLENESELQLPRSRDRVLIVHFWASWCEPCREEFPKLAQAMSQIAAIADLQLISLDEGRDEALRFLKSMGLPVKANTAGWDPMKLLSIRLGTSKMPETYIFTRDGKLERKISGPMNWTDPVNLDYFRNIAGN